MNEVYFFIGIVITWTLMLCLTAFILFLVYEFVIVKYFFRFFKGLMNIRNAEIKYSNFIDPNFKHKIFWKTRIVFYHFICCFVPKFMQGGNIEGDMEFGFKTKYTRLEVWTYKKYLLNSDKLPLRGLKERTDVEQISLQEEK